MSPFMASLGYQPLLFKYQEEEVGVPSVQVNLRHCRSVWRQVHTMLTRSSLQTQRQANCHRVPAPRYRAGQKVWLSSKDLPLQVESRKLAPGSKWSAWSAPQRCASDSWRLCRFTHPSTFLGLSQCRPDLPLPPRMIDGALAFHVQCILDVWRWGRRWQFLVNSVGYGPEERSWVPWCHILDKDLLHDFYRDHPEKPGRVSGGAR